jgi:hypothetical protein
VVNNGQNLSKNFYKGGENMPETLINLGEYIEEVSSGVCSISSVSKKVTPVIDIFQEGHLIKGRN